MIVFLKGGMDGNRPAPVDGACCRAPVLQRLRLALPLRDSENVVEGEGETSYTQPLEIIVHIAHTGITQRNGLCHKCLA